MLSIDQYAYASKLKSIDAMEKLFFSLTTLFICLWADMPVISIIVFVVMTWVIVCKGGTPLNYVLKLLLVPMMFLLLSVVTIAISISSQQTAFLFSLPVLGRYIGVTAAGASEAMGLFLKAMGSVSCLYFLTLTTPMVELLSALRRLKCPALLAELMSLIYRFIFVLLDTAHTMYLAQQARLGYSSFVCSYRSLGALASTLFIRSYKRSEALYTALETRGYEDEIKVLDEPVHKQRLNYLKTLGLNTVLLIITLLVRV